MSTRPNLATSRHRTHPSHAHTHIQSTAPIIQRTTSRPGTPNSRGDILSRKSSSSSVNLRQQSQPHMQVVQPSQPSTPTPRKPRQKRGNKPFSQRNLTKLDGNEVDTVQLPEIQPSSEDEEMLFDLLGVTSPLKKPDPSYEKGILFLPQEDMQQVLSKRIQQRKKNDRNGLTDSEVDHKPQRNDASPAPVRGSRNIKSRRQHGENEGEAQGVASENDAPRPREKGKRGKKNIKGWNGDDHVTMPNDDNAGSVQISGITATRPRKGAKAHPNAITSSATAVPGIDCTAASEPFDVTSLSKSLPSNGLVQPSRSKTSGKGRLGKRGDDSGDESKLWEMPEVAGGQELTWQQKLQSQPTPENNSTPRRSTKSTPSDRKSKTRALVHSQAQAVPTSSPHSNPRPVHNRRLSLDDVPTASSSAPAAQVAAGRTFSAFDSHIPFHTGYNVHRAPQTPAKGVASANGNSNFLKSYATGGEIDLPIVGSGEFPRLAGGQAQDPSSIRRDSTPGQNQSQNQNLQSQPLHPALGGVKYAGPTFHNSPHAASLPKPDLEDF